MDVHTRHPFIHSFKTEYFYFKISPFIFTSSVFVILYFSLSSKPPTRGAHQSSPFPPPPSQPHQSPLLSPEVPRHLVPVVGGSEIRTGPRPSTSWPANRRPRWQAVGGTAAAPSLLTRALIPYFREQGRAVESGRAPAWQGRRRASRPWGLPLLRARPAEQRGEGREGWPEAPARAPNLGGGSASRSLPSAGGAAPSSSHRPPPLLERIPCSSSSRRRLLTCGFDGRARRKTGRTKSLGGGLVGPSSPGGGPPSRHIWRRRGADAILQSGGVTAAG
jgi:hypothetical protein